jgi:hypothetical protein
MANKMIKILDALHHKELIGDELKFQYIIDGNGNEPMTLKILSDKLDKLADVVANGFARLDERMDKLEKDIDNIVVKNNLLR